MFDIATLGAACWVAAKDRLKKKTAHIRHSADRCRCVRFSAFLYFFMSWCVLVSGRSRWYSALSLLSRTNRMLGPSKVACVRMTAVDLLIRSYRYVCKAEFGNRFVAHRGVLGEIRASRDARAFDVCSCRPSRTNETCLPLPSSTAGPVNISYYITDMRT